MRNAVDHGIEGRNERRAAMKGDCANITISARVADDSFTIEFSDDGRGIDWDAVRERAQRLAVACRSDSELTEALFVDGLSTAPTVTDESGRGIGMGAVRSACQQRGGRITVTSTLGKGTQLRFAFPRDRVVCSPKPLAVSTA